MGGETRIRDLVPIRRIEFVFAFDNLLEEFGVILVVERRISTKEDVGNDADAPHVHFAPVWLLLQHLGRYTARCKEIY